MYKWVQSRSVHNFGTCKKNAAARCWIPIKKRAWPQNLSEVGTAQRHGNTIYIVTPQSKKIGFSTVEFETFFGTGGSNVKPFRSIFSFGDPNFTCTTLRFYLCFCIINFSAGVSICQQIFWPLIVNYALFGIFRIAKLLTWGVIRWTLPIQTSAQFYATCSETPRVKRKVPEVSIRDWTGSPNNCMPRRPKLSAIDVIWRAIFEGLVLVSGWRFVEKVHHHALGAHTPTNHPAAISQFRRLFSKDTQKYNLLGTCSNPADLWYPHQESE